MQDVTPFLWFNDQAEEAMNFYTTVFRDAEVLSINRMGNQVFGGSFRIGKREFHTLNGGPVYQFTPAISLYIDCETQEEVDELWEKLSAGGGEPGKCGWLKDKYGLSWQVIPKALPRLMSDKDPKKAQQVMQAMMQMGKIEISKLEEAYNK